MVHMLDSELHQYADHPTQDDHRHMTFKHAMIPHPKPPYQNTTCSFLTDARLREKMNLFVRRYDILECFTIESPISHCIGPSANKDLQQTQPYLAFCQLALWKFGNKDNSQDFKT